MVGPLRKLVFVHLHGFLLIQHSPLPIAWLCSWETFSRTNHLKAFKVNNCLSFSDAMFLIYHSILHQTLSCGSISSLGNSAFAWPILAMFDRAFHYSRTYLIFNPLQCDSCNPLRNKEASINAEINIKC